MTQNIGTLVISAIRPNDSLDTYPTFLTSELKGSLKQVDNYIDLSSISVFRKLAGMLVNVIDDSDSKINGSFKLNNDTTTWSYTENNNEVITLNVGSLTSDKHIVVLLNTLNVYTVDSVYTKSISGTCTVEVNRKYSIPLEFNLSTSSTRQGITSNSLKNYIDTENYISIKVTNVTTVTGLIVQINLKRILPRSEVFDDWSSVPVFYTVQEHNWSAFNLISPIQELPWSEPTVILVNNALSWQPPNYIVLQN